MNSVEKLKQFEQALKLFLERVAADPNLLAAVLVGSLSEETIWRRDALGLWVIEKDGVTKRLRAMAKIVGKSVQLHAISVEPGTVEFAPPLAEGAMRTVPLKIKARAGLANGLFEILLQPVNEKRRNR